MKSLLNPQNQDEEVGRARVSQLKYHCILSRAIHLNEYDGADTYTAGE